MIHYILLPEQEMKKLRWEYRTRLIIVFLFFISCAMVVGILALLPSYILSHSQDVQAQKDEQDLQNSRKASGAAEIEKDLVQVQAIATNIIADKDSVVYSDVIQNIISHKSGQIFITSFQISYADGSSTPVAIIVQGIAGSRESLVSFKDSLTATGTFASVELPVSDLAKSKDISFALRLTLNRK